MSLVTNKLSEKTEHEHGAGTMYNLQRTLRKSNKIFQPFLLIFSLFYSHFVLFCFAVFVSSQFYFNALFDSLEFYGVKDPLVQYHKLVGYEYDHLA